MNLQEFEIFNKYSEIYIDKTLRVKVLGELKELFDQIVRASGGQRALRDAAGAQRKADMALLDATKASEALKMRESAAQIRDQERARKLDERERIVGKQLIEVGRREKQCSIDMKKAGREIAAHATLNEELKSAKEEFEARLAKIAAAAA